jgi:hypothetical protein
MPDNQDADRASESAYEKAGSVRPHLVFRTDWLSSLEQPLPAKANEEFEDDLTYDLGDDLQQQFEKRFDHEGPSPLRRAIQNDDGRQTRRRFE